MSQRKTDLRLSVHGNTEAGPLDCHTCHDPHTFRPVNESEDLYLVSAEGGIPRRLTTLPFDKSGVGWSSDGRTIYFSGDENQDEPCGVVIVSYAPRWSPDGSLKE